MRPLISAESSPHVARSPRDRRVTVAKRARAGLTCDAYATLDPAAARHSQLQPPNSNGNSNSEPAPTVRFNSTVEEFNAPEATSTESASPADNRAENGKALEESAEITSEELRALSKSLRGAACPLQERRMNHFAYEPFSLPASRVCLKKGPASPSFVPCSPYLLSAHHAILACETPNFFFYSRLPCSRDGSPLGKMTDLANSADRFQ